MSIEDTDTDNFAAAFEKLAELGDANPPADLAELAPEASVESTEPAVEDTQEDLTVADDTQESAEELDESPEEPDEGPSEAPQAKLSDDELLDRFARIVKQSDAPAAETHQVPPEQQQQPYYTEEEAKFVQDYEKDWPDIARAETLRRRAEYRDLVGYVFQEVAKEIMPLMDMARTVSERTHLQDLQSAVGDYDNVRDKVIDWVSKQPAYLRPAYNHVIQNGTVDEVVDLIDRYKQATGAQMRTSAPASRRMETELPTATKQAAAALAPVSSKRSAIIAGQDPNDFESAFASFADKL